MQTQMARMKRKTLFRVKWRLYIMGRKMQYHLSIARHVTFKIEIFPNVKRACLLARTRQKSSPAKPGGTGNESMLITNPGVRGMKIPVDNKNVALLCSALNAKSYHKGGRDTTQGDTSLSFSCAILRRFFSFFPCFQP